MKKTNRVVRQVKAKAQKPSTYAAISGLAAGLAPLFPQYAPFIAAVGLVAGAVGTFKGVPAESEAP